MLRDSRSATGSLIRIKMRSRAGTHFFVGLTGFAVNVQISLFKSMPEDSQDILTRELVVQNKMGIHARPAAMIVRIANKYPGVELEVAKDDERVNGKSIMGLMMLAAGNGSKLEFFASGADVTMAQHLLDELTGLFERRFDEV